MNRHASVESEIGFNENLTEVAVMRLIASFLYGTRAMRSLFSVRKLPFFAGFALAGLLALAFWGGSLWNQSQNAHDPASLPSILKADTAAGGKTISLATARINEDVEGFYVLDHITKNLFCFVISSRTGQQVGTYSANLSSVFAAGKQGDLDFALTTGYINANNGGRVGQGRTAESLCYVCEGNSGIAMAFSFQFNQTLLQNSVPEQGQLILVWQGLIRDPALNPQPAANGNQPGQNNPIPVNNNNNNNNGNVK